MEIPSSHPAATRGFLARLPPAQNDRKRHAAALPGLRCLERVLDALPDERRGGGRNDYPIAGVVFLHASVEMPLRELSGNPALPDPCGFHPYRARAGAGMSRIPRG